MTQTTKTQYQVGLLLRSEFRKLLEKMTWEVPTSKYKEVKGFFESTFYVEAPIHTINQLNSIVEKVNSHD